MASRDKTFIIPFVGLKLGKHEFDFVIGDEFFENYEYTVVHKGKLNASLELEKKETMLIGEFKVSGVVEAECDRCGGEMNQEIEGGFRLIFKFEDEDQEDESLVSIGQEAYELDTADHFYELITVSLPTRNLHDEEDCDPEVMEKLQELRSGASEDEDDNDDDVDPRWEALKKLK